MCGLDDFCCMFEYRAVGLSKGNPDGAAFVIIICPIITSPEVQNVVPIRQNDCRINTIKRRA